MDLTVINGLGPARREKLESAGVKTVSALAEVDIEELSDDVGISTTLLNDFRTQARDLVALDSLEGVGEANLEKLVEADVRSLKDLSSRDVGDLHEATGIPEAKLRTWRRKAGPKAAEQAARTAVAGAVREFENARVVLREGINDARLKLEEDVLAEARILPIRAKDNVDKALEQVKGNVVVLREKADTAIVRVGDSVQEGIPIFKEKVAEAQGQAEEQVQEVRVRVQEIRDKRVIPKASALKEKVKGLFSKGRDDDSDSS